MALPRAVVYCRCSTEEESQADALRNQVLESEACVKEQGWFLADKYVELKSGSETEKFTCDDADSLLGYDVKQLGQEKSKLRAVILSSKVKWWTKFQ